MTHWRSKEENREAIVGWAYFGLIVLSLFVLICFAMGRII